MSVKDKNKMSKGKSAARQEGLDLFMECEDEELSASQISAHQQAESEYEEAIQKINALKSGNVQIIQSNQNASVPVPVAGPAPVPGMVVGQQRNLQQQLIGSPRVVEPITPQPGQQQQFIIQNSISVSSSYSPNPPRSSVRGRGRPRRVLTAEEQITRVTARREHEKERSRQKRQNPD